MKISKFSENCFVSIINSAMEAPRNFSVIPEYLYNFAKGNTTFVRFRPYIILEGLNIWVPMDQVIGLSLNEIDTYFSTKPVDENTFSLEFPVRIAPKVKSFTSWDISTLEITIDCKHYSLIQKFSSVKELEKATEVKKFNFAINT